MKRQLTTISHILRIYNGHSSVLLLCGDRFERKSTIGNECELYCEKNSKIHLKCNKFWYNSENSTSAVLVYESWRQDSLSLFLFLFLFLSLFPPSLSVSRPLSAFISSVSFFSLSSLSLSPCIFLSHSFYLFKLPFSLSHTYLTLISRPFVYMRYNRLTILHIFCTFIFSFLFRGRIFYVVAVIFTFYHMCV